MMKYLFSHLEEFEKFKNDPETAVITDIDGTISQIVSKPDEAVVTSKMRNFLTRLADKFKLVAVISGRPVKDAQKIVGVDNLLYVGSHGLEYMKNGKIHVEEEVERYVPIIKEVACKLEEEDSCNIEGVLFEDKGLCFSIHYRLCEEPEKAREIILDSLEDALKTTKNDNRCENLKIKEGRKIVEIRPPIGYDKGTILEKLTSENHVEKLVYFGDDITDNDAFSKLNQLKCENKLDGESVLVLSEEIPDYLKKNASFFVENVDEVQKFFKWLLND
jgi:trehalose 6-phosphate phosphatase